MMAYDAPITYSYCPTCDDVRVLRCGNRHCPTCDRELINYGDLQPPVTVELFAKEAAALIVALDYLHDMIGRDTYQILQEYLTAQANVHFARSTMLEEIKKVQNLAEQRS